MSALSHTVVSFFDALATRKKYYNNVRTFEFCPPGSYTLIEGAVTKCIPCKVLLEAPLSHLGSSPLASCSFSPSRSLLRGFSLRFFQAGEVAPRGATECTPCGYGKYGNSTSNATCYDCPSGKYSDLLGGTECKTCAIGLFSRKGWKNCHECPAGSYGIKSGVEECESCGAGSFQEARGQTSCNHCTPGTWSGVGSTKCKHCHRGEYQDQTKSQTCKKCPFGKFGSIRGATLCTSCQAGRYTSNTSSTVCELCEPGSHQRDTGQSSCKACAEGRYSGPAAEECEKCEAGKSSSRGAQECEDCPSGKAAESGGQASPHATLSMISFILNPASPDWILRLTPRSLHQLYCRIFCQTKSWLLFPLRYWQVFGRRRVRRLHHLSRWEAYPTRNGECATPPSEYKLHGLSEREV